MPQVGWRDPESGREEPFDFWLSEAEAYGSALGFPYEILHGIHAQLTAKDRPDGFTATQLSGCARAVHLDRLTDYFTDPQDDYAAFRGTLVHGILEDHAPLGSVTERRVYRMYDGIEISGQFDTVRVSGAPDGFLEDWLEWCDEMFAWETPGVLELPRPVAPEIPDGARFHIKDLKTKHEVPQWSYVFDSNKEQGNMLRWLLRVPKGRVDIEFVYVSMKGVKTIPLYDGGRYSNGRAKPEQVWTDREVHEYLDRRLRILKAQSDVGRPLAYANVPVDDLWECDWCPIRRTCYDLAAEEARAAWANGEGARIPPRVKADEEKAAKLPKRKKK